MSLAAALFLEAFSFPAYAALGEFATPQEEPVSSIRIAAPIYLDGGAALGASNVEPNFGADMKLPDIQNIPLRDSLEPETAIGKGDLFQSQRATPKIENPLASPLSPDPAKSKKLLSPSRIGKIMERKARNDRVEFTGESFDGVSEKGSAMTDLTSSEERADPALPMNSSAAGARTFYRKRDISAARFGEAERQALIKKARTLKEMVDQKIIGQDRATTMIQDRLVQYFEGFGTRAKDPIAAHLIGLPGIGKTAMLDAIAKLGFNVERIDVQKYVKGGNNSGNSDYARDLSNIAERNKDKPYILLVDELDKLPEIVNGQEETIPFIGALNQILTDGFISVSSSLSLRPDFSNAMIVTTMNFNPKEIESFSAEALATAKKYYDFTIDDFAAFDSWIQKDSSARYKLLMDLFRSNTVSRLAPNMVIMKPLLADDYVKIVKLTVDSSIAAATQGSSAKKRVAVVYTQAFLDFLYRQTVFAPSGARETIAKANALTEQLITFGVKATVKGDESLDRPRLISLDFNSATGLAEVRVTPQVSRWGRLEGKPSFKIDVAYDPSARLFTQPIDIAMNPPAEKRQAAVREKLLKKEIFAARFPKNRKLTLGLSDKINESLIGQEDQSKLVEKEFNSYLNRPGPVANQPPFLVFAGFPGIGKSELANLTAKHLDLPLVRVNMQAYSSDSQQTVSQFGRSLSNAITQARQNAKNGKFIILFEELDKVFEIDAEGKLVNRPIMAIIKDLLQDGVVSIPSDQPFSSNDNVVDVRGAYNIITMNFAGDRFRFEADPRLTTIEDTRRAAQTLAMRPAALKKTLGSMFLPETVSRLMPRFHIMMPLNESNYKKLINIQAARVVQSRLTDPKTGRNKSLLTVEMTSAYRKYLFGETVIPSEGARNTVVAAQNRISSHLEEALSKIPKSSGIATQPASILLDFRPAKSLVVASLIPHQGSKAMPRTLYKREVALSFPPLAIKGRMPVGRVKTAAHEFGHAYTAVSLGLRFEYATAVPPKPGVGGYVKYNTSGAQTARTMIARLYSALGSRAMERIFMSKDPLSPLSVLDITPGPSGDILSATQTLWNILFELGFDPGGGTLDRLGINGPSRYAAFADIPPETVDKLGKILRRMENALVANLLNAHDQSWYQDKIGKFARDGGLTESQFYDLIGYPYPGHNAVFLGEKSRIAEIFADQVEKPLPEVAKAAAFKQGRLRATALQNMDSAIAEFSAIVKTELHSDPAKK